VVGKVGKLILRKHIKKKIKKQIVKEEKFTKEKLTKEKRINSIIIIKGKTKMSTILKGSLNKKTPLTDLEAFFNYV